MYTKHYYNGASRIASRVSGCFRNHADLNYEPLNDHASTWLSTGLGSSSYITDINGDATQHMQYSCTELGECVPFGEDFIHEQNTTSYYTPYTFSGKERDMETGLSYFGARYYDAGLSIWLSVDPRSNKYPSMSAYNYCAWNPVMLVDPDGREVEEANIPPGKIWDRIKEFFGSSTDCSKNFKAKAPHKAPKGDFKPREVKRNEWVDVETHMAGDHDLKKEYKLSPHKKTRIKYNADRVPDEFVITDDKGNSQSTGWVSGRGKIELGKGIKRATVDVNANQNTITTFDFKVEQRGTVVVKRIQWSWNGMLPKRTVTRYN